MTRFEDLGSFDAVDEDELQRLRDEELSLVAHEEWEHDQRLAHGLDLSVEYYAVRLAAALAKAAA